MSYIDEFRKKLKGDGVEEEEEKVKNELDEIEKAKTIEEIRRTCMHNRRRYDDLFFLSDAPIVPYYGIPNTLNPAIHEMVWEKITTEGSMFE